MNLLLQSALALAAAQPAGNLIVNPDFSTVTDGKPSSFEIKGNVVYGKAGYRDEVAGMGVALDSYAGKGRPTAGSVSQFVRLTPASGRWVNFRIRGRAEDGFALAGDQLYLRIDFFSKNGQNFEDTAKRLIWREVLQDRKDFGVNGDNHKNGAAVWRTYQFEERLPFEETDCVKVTLGFESGAGKVATYSRFYATEFQVTQSVTSLTGKKDPTATAKPAAAPNLAQLIHLGGRWYYQPQASHLSLK